MRTFTQKQHAIQQASSTMSRGAYAYCKQCGEAKAGPPVQRMSGNQVHSGYDFSRIPVYSKAPIGPLAKMAVNTPGDVYEREADTVADRVMAMSPSSSSAAAARDTGGLAGGQEPDAEGEPDIGGAGQAPAAASIPSLGAGSPLAASERSFMEPRFGRSFANVRVHTDSRANDVAASVGARAFALGNHIVFGKGEGSSSGAGRRLLAHELTHVVQQRGGDRGGMNSPADPNVLRRYLAGPPPRVGLTTTTPVTYGECRNFNTVVSWNTDLRNGFIIQECLNADSITRCADGASVPAPNTPHYWEAWQVDGTGAISDGNADTWFRGGRPGTRGWWTFDSNVFALAGALDPAWGFTRGGVPTAGGLLATTTGPSRDQVYQPSMTRHHGGTWNCCDAVKTHVPR